MKTRVLIVCLLAFWFHGYAQEINLNGTWNFALAKTEKEANRLAGFYAPDYKTGKFTPIPVPSNWAVLGFEEPVYQGFDKGTGSEGFYIREFSLPQGWADRRVLLHFGGVWASAEVWLNGRALGSHESGYTSFSFEVTGLLNATSTNRLAVRVRQATRDNKFDTYDDWTLGGIYRDVTLEAMPRERWLDYVTVKTLFDNRFEDADLKIRVMVGDTHEPTRPVKYHNPGEPYDLRFILSTKEGTPVARRQITVPAHTGSGREHTLSFHLESPFKWTAETPYLYDLHVELIEKGEVVHTRSQKVGFRQISTEGGVLRINGQAVKLRGVNRHDEHPDVGRATTREHWIKDLTMMKAANINYVRTAHYAHAKGFIELCDQMGMYVGEEVSLGGRHARLPDPYHMYNPLYAAPVLLRSYETIVRDINSPSVIYWSIGNENPLTTLHMAALKLVNALDPTRPTLIPWHSENWLPEEIGLLSAHYWQPQDLDQWAAQALRPVISSEYTHAFGNDGAGGLDARWKAITRHPSGAGAAIWMWADQGIKTPKPGVRNEFNGGDQYLRIDSRGWDGIVDSYRNPTRDYLEVKAVYAQVYPSEDKITFMPGQESVYVPIRNDFDFTDLSTVKIDWTLWEDGRQLDSDGRSVAGAPHTSPFFELPVAKISEARPEKTYYAQFVFTGTDGTEITRRSVELEPLVKQQRQIKEVKNLSVTKDENVTVHAGEASYTFDQTTGHLALATLRGEALITGLRPIIWRELNQSELFITGAPQPGTVPDLNLNTPSLKSWEVERQDDRIIIRAQVEYTVDADNHFTASYKYTVEADGRLGIHYQITTRVQAPWLPIVGMALRSPEKLGNIHWMGLGPHDAYPNKRSAPILGVWGGEAGSSKVAGNKETRWIERTGTEGGIRITNVGYMMHERNTPDEVNILSAVLSRPEKGRKAELPFPQLKTNTDFPMIGEFSIALF
ncbi:MAG: beta galactosidase jelly roll domain-containing protein [Porphyromonadaceae bacterium]|nr:beta galactosidase jelly roll domain-containing protein [Porphyromonadaceae bacterium]